MAIAQYLNISYHTSMPTKSATPTVETNSDFILIKIPRDLFVGQAPEQQFSDLESGLRESFNEARNGKLQGPFKTSKAFLGALKKPAR